MKRIKIKDPVWANQLKDRIIFLVEYEDDQGKIQIVEDAVNKYPDAQGIVHEDWQLIIDEFGLEGLDANLAAIAERQQQIASGDASDRAPDSQDPEEQERIKKNREQEELFKTKLEAFEMDIVKNCTDREIKAKIRKSTSKTAVYSIVALLMLQAGQNPEEELNTSSSQT